MTFLYPMGLWALLAIPAIIALHYFRQQKRSQKIGGLHLWDFAQIATPAGGRFDRLIKNLPLLFQLLAALLLALLISGFDIPMHQTVRHQAVIIDSSVSMQARVRGTTSAQRSIEALAELTKDADRFTLVTAGDEPVMLAGPSATREEFEKTLRDWRPTGAVANFSDALNIASKFAGDSGRIILVTDNPDEAGFAGDSVAVVGVGRAAANNAIVFADRFRAEKNKERVVATVQAFGGSRHQVTLTVWHGEQAVGSQQVDLETSKPVSIEMELPAVNDPLRLTLTPEDALGADDTAIVLPGVIKPVRVYLPDDLPQRAAFEKAAMAVKDVLLAAEPGEADLIFTTDTTGPLVARRVYRIATGGTSETLRVAPGRDLVSAPDSAIAKDISFAGIVWPFHGDSVPKDPRVALRADLSFTSVPLLYMDAMSTRSAQYRMNLDLSGSYVFRHTAWPILMFNIIEECREALPGLSRTNLRAGEDLAMNLELDPDGEQLVTLWREGEGEAKLEQQDKWDGVPPVLLSGLAQGNYVLRQGEAADAPEVGRFRVNLFSGGESDLQGLKELKVGAEGLAAMTGMGEGEREGVRRNVVVYYVMLVGLIGCILLGWVYHDAGR